MIIFVWLAAGLFAYLTYQAETVSVFITCGMASALLGYFAWWGTPALHGRDHIKPKKITEWREICDEHDLAKALADVTGTPRGNVGQHIGYHISETARLDMPNWNYADKLNVAWLLDHPQDRIRVGYTRRADIGNIQSPRAE